VADDDTNTKLDQADADAVRFMIGQLSDNDVVRVYEQTGGQGPVADTAADQMEKRDLDY
jgi:hypothetical protein